MNITRIIVIDNATAKDDFKKMSLNLSKPPDITLNIFSVAEALQKVEQIEALEDQIMLIFGGTKDALAFSKGYPKIQEINYGGIANKEGSKAFSNAIYLTEEEVTESKEMADAGIRLYMQQVPTSKLEELNPKL